MICPKAGMTREVLIMNLKNDSAVLRLVVCLKYAIPLLFATCLALPAHATLITFDDLTQPSCPPGPDSDFTFCDPLYVTDLLIRT